MPLFTRSYDRFESTQDYVRDVLGTVLRTGATRHLEIETYTWDVLPAGLKRDLLESIAREYEWVLSTLRRPQLSRNDGRRTMHKTVVIDVVGLTEAVAAVGAATV